MTDCPKCGSAAIVNQRVDSDWHENPATQVNDSTAYTEQQIKDLDKGKLKFDVDVNICLDCNARFA